MDINIHSQEYNHHLMLLMPSSSCSISPSPCFKNTTLPRFRRNNTMPDLTSIFQNLFQKTVTIPFSCLIFSRSQIIPTSPMWTWIGLTSRYKTSPSPRTLAKTLTRYFNFKVWPVMAQRVEAFERLKVFLSEQNSKLVLHYRSCQ